MTIIKLIFKNVNYILTLDFLQHFNFKTYNTNIFKYYDFTYSYKNSHNSHKNLNVVKRSNIKIQIMSLTLSLLIGQFNPILKLTTYGHIMVYFVLLNANFLCCGVGEREKINSALTSSYHTHTYYYFLLTTISCYRRWQYSEITKVP